MLMALRGRTHDVHTGLCLVEAGGGSRSGGRPQHAGDHARLRSTAEIDVYVLPVTRWTTGAYAIQYAAFSPVAALDGCYLNVVGLSLCGLILLLRELGVPCRASRATLLAAHDGYPCPLFERMGRLPIITWRRGTGHRHCTLLTRISSLRSCI